MVSLSNKEEGERDRSSAMAAARQVSEWLVITLSVPMNAEYTGIEFTNKQEVGSAT